MFWYQWWSDAYVVMTVVFVSKFISGKSMNYLWDLQWVLKLPISGQTANSFWFTDLNVFSHVLDLFFVVASGGNLDSRETIFESLKKIRRPPSHWGHLKCLLVGCNWTEKQPEFDKCPTDFLNNCLNNCPNTIQKKSWLSLKNRKSLFIC